VAEMSGSHARNSKTRLTRGIVVKLTDVFKQGCNDKQFVIEVLLSSAYR